MFPRIMRRVGPRVLVLLVGFGVPASRAADVVVSDLPERLQPSQGILAAGVSRITGRYPIKDMPEELKGLPYVTVGRGQISLPGTAYAFSVDQPVVVYLAVSLRGDPKLPEDWTRTSMDLSYTVPLNEGGTRTDHDSVWKKKFPAGRVNIPPHEGEEDSRYGLPCLAILAARDRAMARVPLAAGNGTALVSFAYRDERARTAYVVGDFNRWSRTATPMRKGADGLWLVDVPLAAGRHEYKFVVNGVLKPDPECAEEGSVAPGGRNSVKVVGSVAEQPASYHVVARLSPSVSPAAPPISAPVSTAAPMQGATTMQMPAYPRSYNECAIQYNGAIAAYQEYLRTRKAPKNLVVIEDVLRICAKAFDDYRTDAPAGTNVDGLVAQCNKAVFAVHATRLAPE